MNERIRRVRSIFDVTLVTKFCYPRLTQITKYCYPRLCQIFPRSQWDNKGHVD